MNLRALAFLALLCLVTSAPSARALRGDGASSVAAVLAPLARGTHDANESVDPLRRVAVLGASVMAGFGLADEIGRPLIYSDVVDAMLVGEHERVRSFASDRLFMLSLGMRASLVTRLVEHRPSLVVAVDFLFWYAHGLVHDEQNRPLLLEKGLEQLARLDCPVIVGDLPDMGRAVGRSTYLGPSLMAEQMPRPETLVAMNARIASWAAEHPNVIVLPLGDFVEQMFGDEPFAVRDTRWDAGARDAILQSDWLHPTLLGAVTLTALALDRATAALGQHLDQDAIAWDVRKVARDLDPSDAEPEADDP